MIKIIIKVRQCNDTLSSRIGKLRNVCQLLSSDKCECWMRWVRRTDGWEPSTMRRNLKEKMIRWNNNDVKWDSWGWRNGRVHNCKNVYQLLPSTRRFESFLSSTMSLSSAVKRGCALKCCRWRVSRAQTWW